MFLKTDLFTVLGYPFSVILIFLVEIDTILLGVRVFTSSGGTLWKIVPPIAAVEVISIHWKANDWMLVLRFVLISVRFFGWIIHCRFSSSFLISANFWHWQKFYLFKQISFEEERSFGVWFLASADNGTDILHTDSISLYDWGNDIGDSPYLQTSVELYWAHISEIHCPYHLYGPCEYLLILHLKSHMYVWEFAFWKFSLFIIVGVMVWVLKIPLVTRSMPLENVALFWSFQFFKHAFECAYL